MKNKILYALVSLMALANIGCSDENEFAKQDKTDRMVKYTIEASLQDEKTTRVEISEYWDEDDNERDPETSFLKFYWNKDDVITLQSPNDENKKYEFKVVGIQDGTRTSRAMFEYTGSEIDCVETDSDGNLVIKNATFKYKADLGEENIDYVKLKIKDFNSGGDKQEIYPLQSKNNDLTHLDNFISLTAQGNLKVVKTQDNNSNNFTLKNDGSLMFKNDKIVFKIVFKNFPHDIWGGSVVNVYNQNNTSEGRVVFGLNSEWLPETDGIVNATEEEVEQILENDLALTKEYKKGNVFQHLKIKTDATPICYSSAEEGDQTGTGYKKLTGKEVPESANKEMIVYLLTENMNLKNDENLFVRLIDGMSRDEYLWAIRMTEEHNLGENGKRFIYLELDAKDAFHFVCAIPGANIKFMNKNFGAKKVTDIGYRYQWLQQDRYEPGKLGLTNDEIKDKTGMSTYLAKLTNDEKKSSNFSDIAAINGCKDYIQEFTKGKYTIPLINELSKPIVQQGNGVDVVSQKYFTSETDLFPNPVLLQYLYSDGSYGVNVRNDSIGYVILNSLTLHPIFFPASGYITQNGDTIDAEKSLVWGRSFDNKNVSTNNKVYVFLIYYTPRKISNDIYTGHMIGFGTREYSSWIPMRMISYKQLSEVAIPQSFGEIKYNYTNSGQNTGN